MVRLRLQLTLSWFYHYFYICSYHLNVLARYLCRDFDVVLLEDEAGGLSIALCPGSRRQVFKCNFTLLHLGLK